MSFDLDAYRAGRIRAFEREVAHLRAYRGQLEGLLATALRVAVGRTGVDPVVLASVLEELHRRESLGDFVARVLRETTA